MSAISTSKWTSYIPKHGANYAPQISAILENQARYQRELSPAVRGVLKLHVGDDWNEVLLHAIGRALAADPIFKLFSVQPQTDVNGSIAFLKEAVQPPSHLNKVGDVYLEMRTKQVAAHIAPCDASRIAASQALGKNYPQVFVIGLLQSVFSHALTEIRDSLIQLTLLQAQPVKADGDTLERARALQQAVKASCKRAMANHLIGAKKHWHSVMPLEQTATFHFSPRFPAHQILGMYRGSSAQDAAAVWAPVCFTLKLVEIDQFDDAGVSMGKRQVIDVGVCHSKTVVNPEMTAVVNV